MENLARYITRGASACAARPRLILPGTHNLPSGYRPGGMPIQRLEGNQGVRCAGVARYNVFHRHLSPLHSLQIEIDPPSLYCAANIGGLCGIILLLAICPI